RSRVTLAKAPDLPDGARELFASGENRVQVEQVENWVFGVLPDLEWDLSGRAQGEGRLIFAFDPHRLVTGRLHALRSVDDLRRRMEGGATFDHPAAALVEIVEVYIDHIEAILDELS